MVVAWAKVVQGCGEKQSGFNIYLRQGGGRICYVAAYRVGINFLLL